MTDKCKRCHRVLKNPLSMIHGYGPSCWKKVPHNPVVVEMEEPVKNKDEI